MANRDTYRYQFKDGNRIVHVGITNDLDRRESEHQAASGYENGHITQQGPAVTRDSAERWEQEMRDKGYPTEGYL